MMKKGISIWAFPNGTTLSDAFRMAKAAGFDDYRAFLKFFRYHEGLTPTEFRNLYYNTHTNNK